MGSGQLIDPSTLTTLKGRSGLCNDAGGDGVEGEEVGLNHSAADVLCQALVDNATLIYPDESTSSWQCFVDGMPSMPDEAVVLTDEDGHDDGRSMLDGELFYHYGVQMILRGRDHRSGYKKADAVRQALAAIYRQTVTVEGDEYRLHCVAHIGQVLALGKDVPNSKRSMFSLNMSVAYRSLEITTGLSFLNGDSFFTLAGEPLEGVSA